MFKFLSISMFAMAGLFILTGTAEARGRRNCCCSAPAAVAAAPTAPAPAPPAAAQAQAGQETYRSYSYEPADTTYRSYSQPSRSYRNNPSGNYSADRKVRGL